MRATLLLAEDHAWSIFHWLAGGLAHVRWREFWQLIPFSALLLPLAWLFASSLNLLQLSDDSARTLGIRLG